MQALQPPAQNQRPVLHASRISPAADGATAVMLQYQELMQRFLTAQRDVMLAYLGAANPSSSLASSSPPIEWPSPLPTAIPPRDMPVVASMPSPASPVAPSPVAPSPVAPSPVAPSPVALSTVALPPALTLASATVPVATSPVATSPVATAPNGSSHRENGHSSSVKPVASAIIPSPATSSPSTPSTPSAQTTLTVASSPANDARSSAAPSGLMTVETIQPQLVQLVADRTGYPPEALDLDLDLEADLGVDSIKRVEILAGLAEQLKLGSEDPDQSPLELEKLTTIRTLRGILDYLTSTVLAEGEEKKVLAG
jgi:acyl carrier protein